MTDNKAKTCFGCPHLTLVMLGVNIGMAGCTAREGMPLVPHGYKSDTGVFTFWRIPPECPRDGVEKSDEKVRHEDRQSIVVKAMNSTEGMRELTEQAGKPL